MIEGENCPPYNEITFLEGATLVKERFLDFFQGDDKSKVCLLDEQHEKDLCPDDSESFDYFLFGGILGIQIFGEWPKFLSLFGAMIIISASVFLSRFETRNIE